MKLLINTSAVPFNDADQRTICLLGAGISSRSSSSDRNAGRLCRQMNQPLGARRALWSREEDAGGVGVEGNGPHAGRPGFVRVFGVTSYHQNSLPWIRSFLISPGFVAQPRRTRHNQK
jgi:hypothetical protein